MNVTRAILAPWAPYFLSVLRIVAAGPGPLSIDAMRASKKA